MKGHLDTSFGTMLDKGPYEQVQFHPYHHAMLNGGATSGLLNVAGPSGIGGASSEPQSHPQSQSQASQPQTFSTTAPTPTTSSAANGPSLQLPSAFAAFHYSQAAAQQRQQHEGGYLWDNPSSFHHPLPHG